MGELCGIRAVDAFSKGLRMPPVLVNDQQAWGGLSVCEWQLPWLDGFNLDENDDFIVAYHSDGSREVRAACNGPWSATTSVPGLISVIPPGRKVEYRIDGQVGFTSIHVPGKLLRGLSESTSSAVPDFRFAFEDGFASSCMQILLSEARNGSSFNFPYVHAVTRALVLHLMRSFAKPAAAETAEAIPHSDSGLKLDAMLDFIDSRLTEPLSLNDLADRVGVSRAHFARRFRTVTGMSPHRYVTQRRVERAKQMLRETSLCLAQIALDVGFSNQSHFTQVFHACTGQTPSQFRRGADH
ncbi:MAG: AraC family transcriptional regulator [Hydrocarboniphaga sp.]|uniref:helix-turn-helix domain-containing protein n=1 Tax=Hydrocarboniphaga sp. TaxID=2033016 RepID=UPI00262B72BF|nr:AraC family transcriptional regulator [Hydrocarboniphaga sp.]MDB5970310.1 AraC family transcriptional regulator [Hydrocarboniphaga sp.]